MNEERQEVAGTRNTLCIAHRGASAAFHENTIAAIDGAWKAGADIVELDVRTLADGTVALFHDEAVRKQPLDSLSYDQLQALTPGFDVPTLANALSVCSSSQTLLLDLKDDDPTLFEPLLELLTKAQPSWPSMLLQSSHLSILETLSRELVNPTLFYLAEFKRRLLWNRRPNQEAMASMLAENGVSGVTAKDRSFINRKFIAPFHERGLVFYVWTVNTPARIRRYQAFGADGVITNYPELLARQA